MTRRRWHAQAVQAAQITFEDYFMADLEIAPLKIVGWEGVFGTLIMVLVLLPVVYFVPGEDGSGLHENTIETLHVRFLSPPIRSNLIVELQHPGACPLGTRH